MANGVRQLYTGVPLIAFLLPQLSGKPVHASKTSREAKPRALADNPMGSFRGKHIDVCHDFIGELVNKKNNAVHGVKSGLQHADILPKALERELFDRHRHS